MACVQTEADVDCGLLVLYCNGVCAEVETDAAAAEKRLVDAAGDDGKEENGTVIVKAAKLSSKLRRRMYNRLMSQLCNARLRTRETVERLNFTVDLVINPMFSTMYVSGAQPRDKY